MHEKWRDTSENGLIKIIFSLDIIKDYASIIYRTSNGSVGEEAAKITPQRPVQHGFNGKFSQVSTHKTSNLSAHSTSKNLANQSSMASTPPPNVSDILTTLRTGKTRSDLKQYSVS